MWCLLLYFCVFGEEPKVTSSVELKFWGRVFMDVHYDTADVRGQTDWATYLTASGPEEVNFNPRDTRFGFSASNSFNGYVAKAIAEIDFHGTNAGNNLIPRLRLGYVQLTKGDWDFRAGQDWVPIAQQNPNMIEFGILAWSGNLWWRVPQLTLRKKSGSWEFLGSLMKHRISSSQEQEEKMPWLLVRAAQNFGKNTWAIGAGYRDVTVGGIDYSPYLVVLEGKFAFSDMWTLNGEIWTGQGAAREFVRYGLDYNASTGKEIEGNGGFLCLSGKVSDSWNLNFGAGMDDPKDEDTFQATTTQPISTVPFVRNVVFFANVKHNLSKQFGYGFEWMHFITDTTPQLDLDGERFTFGCWYIF